MPESSIIDVHSHATALKAAAGRGSPTGTPNEVNWLPVDTIAMMNRNGIGQSVLSPMPIGIPTGDATAARDIARSMNEELAEIVRGLPHRLGGFAVLPLGRVEDAVAEAEHALSVLKLDGVCIPTNIDGVYPGEPQFQPVFEKLDELGAVVFIHPVGPQVFADISLGIDEATLEFMFESTRMITSLVYNGVIRRCPNLKIISTHGGGTLPYLADRIATHAGTRNAHRLSRPISSEAVIEDFRTLYFDLAAAMNPGALAAILELMPRSHLLAGFDFPIRPERLFAGDLDVLSTYRDFTDDDRRAIRRENALTLFPRFATAGGAGPI